MDHTAKTQNDMKHLCTMPGYFIFNLWLIVSWLAYLGNCNELFYNMITM